MRLKSFRVSEAARIAGVSVRTLHHYDEVGLLVPFGRSAAGYRLYTESDLLRLHQIIVAREIGLSLEEIRRLLDDPKTDRRTLLQRQRAQLVRRERHTQAMIQSIDVALAMLDSQTTDDTTESDMQRMFEGFEPHPYADEAEQRWGHTEAYQESVRRARGYSREDWLRFRREWDGIMADAAAALRAGRAPDDPATMDVAERHRLSIDRWFYPCDPVMHARLADLYEADERFARNIDTHEPGLTPFWSAAIRANAARQSQPDAC